MGRMVRRSLNHTVLDSQQTEFHEVSVAKTSHVDGGGSVFQVFLF